MKVICRTEESRPGGRGKKPGKPKQKGLLASFEEWFGSINMMNILYVWFPASWGPSVVEAIQTRNVTCLAKKPIVRDPHIFDRKEAASVKTTLERCGPFSLVVLSQRRSQVTPLSGHSDQNASETFSNKLQLNKVQSSLRQTSAKTTQVRSKAKTS